MPRSSRQSRPAAAAPRAAPVQTRSASTAAAPSTYGRAPPAPTAPVTTTQGSQPGMLAQMAATAGSVAVGSTIGHGISSMLFGGGRSEAAPQPDQLAQAAQAAPVRQAAQAGACEVQAKDFTKCLEVADFQSCSYYLEQLKACQAAAAPY